MVSPMVGINHWMIHGTANGIKHAMAYINSIARAMFHCSLPKVDINHDMTHDMTHGRH